MPRSDAAECGELSPKLLARFAEFVTGELGIKMPESKHSMVQSRLLRRVRELHLESVEQYSECFFTSSNAEEREHFLNAITTNKTDFFREAEHFDYLIRTALPALSRTPNYRPGSRFNIWSAGCSSGEEPYTLAMVLSEYGLHHRGFDFAILGTDVSTRVLELARSGIYEESQIAPVPQELRERYLRQGRGQAQGLVRVAPDLRRKVAFHRLNFMEEDYSILDMFDVVFFRNVLIYFDKPTQEAVINRICRNLVPGGYLFVGHSESLAGLNTDLSCVQTAVFRKPV
ncbi:protein-glutamate O-methyltransferase [uncultured Paludibaculum sp.]|uniref:CheR family methyltransferase n=1 Tax=uncultured Paludibaculum sp. TaxID=1765020 RepID=UPI002AABCBB4|nr:protein-glutamate O-methyltransferase [uncultured Paludibaculum sp.]